MLAHQLDDFPGYGSRGGARIGSYSSSQEYTKSTEGGRPQIFESHGETSIETRIYSSYKLLVWKAVESIDEGDVRSFHVEGPGGYLFSAHSSGVYWGYYNDEKRLHIFSLNDSAISVHVRETLKVDYDYRAFLVQDGRMRAYDCKLDLTPFAGEKSITINGSTFGYNTKNLNLKVAAEVSNYMAKNGVDVARDSCLKNGDYLGEAAMRFNENDMVKIDS